MEFQSWTDDALLSLSEDVNVVDTIKIKGRDGEVTVGSVKAYAAWELDARIAFNEPSKPQPKLELRGDGGKLDALLAERKGSPA
jgi:hypothetical protein